MKIWPGFIMKSLLHKLKVLIFGKTSQSALIRCAVFAVGFYLMFDHMFKTYMVDGPSMDNTLKDGQIVWVNKYHYDFFNPQRHDIVVLWDYELPGETMVKRIIGLPGETVEVIMGYVLINGYPDIYDIDHHDAEYYTMMLQWDNMEPYVLGPNEYFYHGDNRVDSVWGTVYLDDIIGKVVIPSRNEYATEAIRR